MLASSPLCSVIWSLCVSKLPIPAKKICRCTPSAARTWISCATCFNWLASPLFAGNTVFSAATDCVAAVSDAA